MMRSTRPSDPPCVRAALHPSDPSPRFSSRPSSSTRLDRSHGRPLAHRRRTLRSQQSARSPPIRLPSPYQMSTHKPNGRRSLSQTLPPWLRLMAPWPDLLSIPRFLISPLLSVRLRTSPPHPKPTATRIRTPARSSLNPLRRPMCLPSSPSSPPTRTTLPTSSPPPKLSTPP